MKYEVIVKTDLQDRPEDYELSAALVLARHFKSNVTFLRPASRKTPDIEVNGTKWEIKSPKGSSKRTIENNLRTARKQSRNVVIDLRRIKMSQQKSVARINFFLSRSHRFKNILIIAKNKKVIEIL